MQEVHTRLLTIKHSAKSRTSGLLSANDKMSEKSKRKQKWRKQYNKELMHLFGDLDILLFVRISRLNWIGHVSRMYSKRKGIQVFNNNPRGSQLRGQQKN